MRLNFKNETPKNETLFKVVGKYLFKVYHTG